MTALAAGIGAIVALTVALMPAPAAATTYRYWSYWTGGDTWSYSARGPGFRTPEDRGVEGWRFVVSTGDGSQATAPAGPSDYEQLCPSSTQPDAGSKRVAVVLDFGPSGIAPVGESPPEPSVSCLTVPASDTGLQVLQRAAELRFHTSGLICGIAGYPARECPGRTADKVTPPPGNTRAATSPPEPAATAVASPGAEPTPDVATPSPPGSEPSTPPEPASPTTTASARPSAVPVSLGERTPPTGTPSTPPPWVAAIGASLLAALLGLAVLARRGRA